MLLQCNQCDFRYINKHDILANIINRKVEHEALNNHTTTYILQVNNKTLSINQPNKIYELRCSTCWEFHGEIFVTQTINNLHINHLRTIHSKEMAKKDKKNCGTQLLHEFTITDKGYIEYEDYIKSNSKIISNIKQYNINPVMLSNDTDIIKGDEEIAFYIKDDFQAKYEYVVPCVYISKNLCPVCNTYINNEPYNVNYNDMFAHLKYYHNIYNNESLSSLLSILQQCIIFEVNTSRNNITTRKQVEYRYDNKACAIRRLNKMGVPLNLLSRMFGIVQTELGDLAYHGMELLEKPNWVKEVESNNP